MKRSAQLNNDVDSFAIAIAKAKAEFPDSRRRWRCASTLIGQAGICEPPKFQPQPRLKPPLFGRQLRTPASYLLATA
jgi:hypothetical protein